MSSHVLSEVARVCDRVALLRKGELALLATFDETRMLAARRVRVFFAEDVRFDLAFPQGIEVADLKPREWTLKVDGLIGPLLSLLRELPVKDLEVQEPRLEDVLIKYYKEDA